MTESDRPTAVLVDASGRELATITVTERRPGYCAGDFSPADAFAAVKSVFDEFEECVEKMGFAYLPVVEQKIRAMGIRLLWNDDSSAVPVDDLQIYPAEGICSCRPRLPVEVNGTTHIVEPADRVPI